MFQFNDQVKNSAIINIVALIDEPNCQTPYDQALQILGIVQNACPAGLEAQLAEYFKPYVDGLSQYETAVPEFVDRIIYPKQFLTVKNVVQILSLMRFDALKSTDTDPVIEHLSYFINFLKLRFDVTSGIFRKCAIKYSDYAKNFSRVLHFAMETFVPPIILTIDTVEEWENFKQASKEIDYHDEKYPCQYTGINFSHKTYSVDSINHFGADKFPIEIRVDAQKKFDNDFLASDSSYAASRAELENQLKEIVPDKYCPPTPSIFKQHWLLLTSFAVSLIVLLGLIFWPKKVNTDVPDWMVGTWKGDMVLAYDLDSNYYALHQDSLLTVKLLGQKPDNYSMMKFDADSMLLSVLGKNQVVGYQLDSIVGYQLDLRNSHQLDSAKLHLLDSLNQIIERQKDQLKDKMIYKGKFEYDLVISKNGHALFINQIHGTPDTTEIKLSYNKKKGTLGVSGDEKIVTLIDSYGGFKSDKNLETLSLGSSILGKDVPEEDEDVAETAKEVSKEILYLSVVEEVVKDGDTTVLLMLSTSAENPATTARYDRATNLLYYYDDVQKKYKEVDLNNYTVDMNKLSDEKAYITMRRK